MLRRLSAGLGCLWLSTQVCAAPLAFHSQVAPGRDVAGRNWPIEFVAQSPKAAVKIGALIIETPWARATPPGAKVGGGFLRITNTGSEPDRLLGGSAVFADHVEIHETSMVDNVMQMRELTEGIEIPPGQTVELKPGSFHLMFLGMTEPLKEGAHVKVTLDFQKAGKAEVKFDVVGFGAGAPDGEQTH